VTARQVQGGVGLTLKTLGLESLSSSKRLDLAMRQV